MSKSATRVKIKLSDSVRDIAAAVSHCAGDGDGVLVFVNDFTVQVKIT